MRLSRRKFFGAAAGAAAAAPAVAREIGTGGVGKLGLPASVQQAAECGSAPADYLWHERKRLEAMARGEMEEHHETQFEHEVARLRHEAAVANIDSLRSVSPPVKRLMMLEKSKASLRRDWVDDAKRELRWLLKRYGR